MKVCCDTRAAASGTPPRRDLAQVDAVEVDRAGVGVDEAHARLVSVDLPDPVGPTMAMVPPAGMSRVTSLRAGLRSVPPCSRSTS